MLSIRRILFPTDFSEGAARAFPQAVALADWHAAELHLVNVTTGDGPSEESLPRAPSDLARWLGPTQSEALRGSLSLVQKQVPSRDPAGRLLAYVEDQDIDLVVMGTHGRRGVRRMILGSVTEEVVRKAHCPVLTIRTEAEGPPRQAVRRILVPVDFSEAAERAVEHAIEIAQTYGAEIHLLHVVEQVVYPSVYGYEASYFPTEEVVGAVEDRLADIARDEIGYEHVQIAATVGDAPLTILDYMNTNGVDLLVIATHGRSGLDWILLGSVTERVLRQSPVPVFVVKPSGKSLVPSARTRATTVAE